MARKEAAAEYATPDQAAVRHRQSVGPGTKMPSLTDPAIYIGLRHARGESYRRQLQIMIEERVDAILIETCFDVLQAKCVADYRH